MQFVHINERISMHFSYFPQQFECIFISYRKSGRGIAACICMHRNDMEKGAHKLLLYFVAIFILPTLVRKLRDETTRREEIARRACVWPAWLAVWICIYVANTVTQQAPPLPLHNSMLHPVAALTVGKRGVYAIFTRDTQQMAALYAMAPYFSAKQGKTKERTKQNREKKEKNNNKNKIEN